MDRIGVVGLDWRRGGPSALARFSLPAAERPQRIADLARAAGARELVYIATCNRVEIAFVTEAGAEVAQYRRRFFAELAGREPEAGEAERVLRAWAGEGAAEHLFLVAAGLDSARIGETEITGQVREAAELSRRLGLLGKRLGPLFVEAIKLARRARERTKLGQGRTSLAEIALDHVRGRLGRAAGPVALLGVSAMTRRCGVSLAEEGTPLLVVNRSLEPARALCGELGGDSSAVALEEFRLSPPPLAALVSATGAPGTILGREELARIAGACGCEPLPLLVDLALPPDVDRAAARGLGFPRVGMEEILATAEESRGHRVLEVREARVLIDEALERIDRLMGQRSVDGAISALREQFQTTAHTQVEHLLRREFGELDPRRRDLLRRFASRLAAHFAHLPSTGLRELALAHGPEAIRPFFARAEGDLAQELDAVREAGDLFGSIADTSGEE